MESIKLTGFKNTQGSPVTPDTRGLVHVSDAESGCGRGWRAASPQLGAGSRAGDRFLSLGTGRASSKGQRPTCHPPGLPPGRKESSSRLCEEAREGGPGSEAVSQPGGAPPPVKTPSRTETETRVASGLNTRRRPLNSLVPRFYRGFPVPCKHCTSALSPPPSPHCGHRVKGQGGGPPE